jgi:TRAP transporter TAXI family solute receptor
MTRMLNWLERHIPAVVAAVLLGLIVLAAVIVLAARPPRQFTILTGREGAGYFRAAQEYRRLAADRGYDLIIRPTSGSVETLRLLEADEAAIGFVQGGVTAGADPQDLSTLAGVFYEPVWVFYRRDFAAGPLVHLYELEGGRINVGEPESGANYLVRQLLDANDVNANNSTLLEMPADESAAALIDGRLDAAIFVVSANSDTVRTLARDPSLDLMSVERATAYRDRFPYLTEVTLPAGAFDLRRGSPAEAKQLPATAANLVIRNDFHPELRRLMTVIAVETHEDGGLFERRFEFPNYDHADLPVGREERGYLERVKRGETTVRDNLPYWATALLARWALFVVPLALLALLALSRSAALRDYFDRRKVDRCYDILRRLDLRAPQMSRAEVKDALAVLDDMEREVVERILLSDLPHPAFADLRGHIALVRERLVRRENELFAD